MAERLYSIPQTADLLGIPAGEVRRLIQAGTLQAERVAGDDRVSERGLVRFLSAQGIDLGRILQAALAEEDEGPQATGAVTEDFPRGGSPEPPRTSPGRGGSGDPPRGIVGDRQNTRRTSPAAKCSTLRGGSPESPRDAAAQLAEAILRDALARGADAIFLEPAAEGLTLKLRVDGQVREKPRFAARMPRYLGPRLLERFRAMAGGLPDGAGSAAFEVTLSGRCRAFGLEVRATAGGEGLAIYPVGA